MFAGWSWLRNGHASRVTKLQAATIHAMRAGALRGWSSAALKRPCDERYSGFMRLDYSSLKIKMV
jgi:hypothetical protein